MVEIPHVTWLRAFDAAARHGSFSTAAAELGITPAAISQQIKLLEQHLGQRLFVRLPRGVTLTNLGHAYARPVRSSFHHIENATAELFKKRKETIVRVRSSVSFATLILAPQLGRFRQQYPDILIQLETVVWSGAPSNDAIDVDIRFGLGDWPERDVMKLGQSSLEVVCNAGYAASLGKDIKIEDVAANRVEVTASEANWEMLSNEVDFDLPTATAGLKADCSLTALQMISRAPGAVVVVEEFSKPYIELGILASPFEYRVPLKHGFFVVLPDGARPRAEVNLLCQWLLTDLDRVSG